MTLCTIKSFRHATAGPREAALQAFKFVQKQGASIATCRAVANQMISSITSDTTQSSENIANVDLGVTCPSTFQDGVDEAHTTDAAAQQAATAAQTALANVAATEVTVTKSYDESLTTCAVQTSNPAW